MKRSQRQGLDFFFIELYSGSEVWADEMRRRGFRVYSFDVLQGDGGDLLRPSVKRRVLRMLSSGMCLGVLAGVPCTSFTRAHRHPIRSACRPHGIAGLSERDQDKVTKGNQLFRNAVDFFRCCRRYRVPFVWENPRTSFQWLMPESKTIARWAEGVDIHIDQCGFGARWRKAITLRCFRIVAPERFERRCRRPRGDLNCQYTGKPHIVLEGRDSRGIHWTARAAAYRKIFGQPTRRRF